MCEHIRDRIKKMPYATLILLGSSGYIFSDGRVRVGIDFDSESFSEEVLSCLDILLLAKSVSLEHSYTVSVLSKGLKIIAPDTFSSDCSSVTYLEAFHESGIMGVSIIPIPHSSQCSYVLRIAGRSLLLSGSEIPEKTGIIDFGPFDYAILPLTSSDRWNSLLSYSKDIGASLLLPADAGCLDTYLDLSNSENPVVLPVQGECCPLLGRDERALIDQARDVLRIKSYSGQEKEMSEWAEKEMLSLGFDDVSTDRYGNVLGIIKGKRPGKTVLLDGHIDTVDVIDSESWTHEPFGAEIEKGRLYGRGSSDMKGSDTAMLFAASSFNDRDFSGNIAVSLTVHEECFEGIAAREVTRRIKPDFVIIGEATESNVNIGQRGRAEVILEVDGKSCHSSNPERGVNAVYECMKALAEIRRIKPPRHPVLGDGILELTDIKSFPYPGASVVPSLCRVTFDRRTLPGESEASILAPISDALEKAGVKGRVYIASGSAYCWTGERIGARKFYPAWITDGGSEEVKGVLSALENTGIASSLSHYSFCTNGSHYAGEAGIKTIGYGPSLERLAHVRDEYIELRDLVEAYRGFMAIIQALVK